MAVVSSGSCRAWLRGIATASKLPLALDPLPGDPDDGPTDGDELQQLLKNLHLRQMAESVPDELQRAGKDGLSYTDLLLRLGAWCGPSGTTGRRPPWNGEWRFGQARLPER